MNEDRDCIESDFIRRFGSRFVNGDDGSLVFFERDSIESELDFLWLFEFYT